MAMIFFRSVADGGKAVVLISRSSATEYVRSPDGRRYFDEEERGRVRGPLQQDEDVSEFDLEHPESLTVRRNVTISVRFSDEEISELRARAERAGVKVTSFIRAAALEATSPVDREALGGHDRPDASQGRQ
jgi:hypothetical protein